MTPFQHNFVCPISRIEKDKRIEVTTENGYSTYQVGIILHLKRCTIKNSNVINP